MLVFGQLFVFCTMFGSFKLYYVRVWTHVLAKILHCWLCKFSLHFRLKIDSLIFALALISLANAVWCTFHPSTSCFFYLFNLVIVQVSMFFFAYFLNLNYLSVTYNLEEFGILVPQMLYITYSNVIFNKLYIVLFNFVQIFVPSIFVGLRWLTLRWAEITSIHIYMC